MMSIFSFFFSSRRRHTRCGRDWSSDVCSSDLRTYVAATRRATPPPCFRGRATSMEGFLFPATYEFFKTTTSAQLVQNQFSAFCDNWQRVDLAYARKKNLTPYDVLIISSMVEKETLS